MQVILVLIAIAIAIGIIYAVIRLLYFLLAVVPAIIGAYIIFLGDSTSSIFFQWLGIDSPSVGWMALGCTIGLALGFARGLYETKQTKHLLYFALFLILAAVSAIWLKDLWKIVFSIPFVALLCVTYILALLHFLLWYIPENFLSAIGLAEVLSPNIAWLILGGSIGTTFGLFSSLSHVGVINKKVTQTKE